jgi:hypothetical protein
MSNNIRTRNGLPYNFVNGIKVRGRDIESLIPGIEGIPEAGSKYQFAGDGTNLVFALPVTPYNKDAVEVHVKQLYVHSTDYTLSGDTITFVEAPPAVVAGETYNVEIKVNLTTLNGYVDANRVSFEDENLDIILQKSKPLGNYSNLRSYAGSATQVRITDPGIEGFFYYDASDIASVDNGGTVILSTGGKRWKRHYDGAVSVKWFGAKGNGVIFDSDAIDAAMAASQYVFLPPGQYRISRPIIWLNHWLVGSLDNGTLSMSNNQTMILADGTFPAFKYQHPNGYNCHGGGIKNVNIYFADGTLPATVATRPDAIGFLCDGTTGYPAFHTFENITVRGAMWAIFDASGSWMAKYKQIHSENSVCGIYKRYGTTHTLESCYHRGGKAGYWFQDVLGVTLNSCAIDLTETDLAGYYPLFVENSNVVWNGGDFEGIKVMGDQREIIRANGASTMLQINGARFLASEVTAGASEQYMVRATNNAKVQLNAVDFTPTSYLGNTGLFAYLVANSGGSISMRGGVLPAVTGGTPASAYSGLPIGGVVTYDDVTATYQWRNSEKSAKGVRGTVFHNFDTLAPSTGNGVNQTITGVALGDFVLAIAQTALPTDVMLFSQVIATDTVNVTAYNVGGLSKTIGAITVNLLVIKT